MFIVNNCHKPILYGCVAASFFLAACGGDGSTIDSVRSGLQSPTGTAANKDAVVAVHSKLEGATPALSLAGGVPGRSLTVDGPSRLSELSPRSMWQSRARKLFELIRSRDPNKRQTLARGISNNSCGQSEAAVKAYNGLVGQLFVEALAGKKSFSAKEGYTEDLAECSDGTLSGTLTVSIEITASSERFTFKVSTKFANACETGGSKACVDGTMDFELSGSGEVSEGEEGEGIAAWDINAKWSKEGASKSAHLRGGLRIAQTENSGMNTNELEYLFFVTDPDGEEHSFVLKLTGTPGEGGSVTIRGKDGEIRCDADGQGVTKCTGIAEHEWTASDAGSLDDSWLE